MPEILISKDRIFVTRNENSEPEKHPICVGECGYIDMPRIEMVNTKVNKVDISFLAGYYANNPGTATIKLVFTSTKNMVNELPFSVYRLVNDSNYENTASLEQFFINEYRLIGSLYRLKLYICPGQWGSIIMHMKVSIPAEKVRLISLLLIAALNYVVPERKPHICEIC